MKPPSDNVVPLSYLAGLFDGEGCVHIYKERRSATSVTYSARASVTLKDSDSYVLECFQERWGGAISRNGAGTNQPCSRWYCCGTNLQAFLQEIVPRLILKKEQAKLALKFVRKYSGFRGKRSNHWSAQGFSEHARNERESLYLRVKELKRVGDQN